MQDITGSSVEVGDASDRESITLRNEIETLQGQFEHLKADVRYILTWTPRLVDYFLKREQLRELVDQRSAELDTLRAISTGPLAPSSRLSGGKSGSDVCELLATFFFLLTHRSDRISMVWCNVWFRRRSMS